MAEELDINLSEGIFCDESCFAADANVSNYDKTKPNLGQISGQDNNEQYQLQKEALSWLDFCSNEADEFYFKAQQMSIQQGIKQCGQHGEDSIMKELINLDAKNSYFSEIDCDTITPEMKSKALPLLMLMVIKCSGELKTRGVATGNRQRLCADKDECSSPTINFFAFKCFCALFAKEGRDAAAIDFPGFFLQTENEGNEPVLLKIAGTVALLLAESNLNKQKKHLRKENGKWVTHASCDRAIHGTMNTAIL